MKDFLNSTQDSFQHQQLAFVIKNYIPYSHKVLLLHQKYGKIVCMFSPNHQASLLTTGSLIWCQVQKTHTVYKFLDLEIEYNMPVSQLQFVHDIMRICFHKIPSSIVTPELFDFLLYAYHNFSNLTDKGRIVVMLRLFLMVDLLPENQEVYKAATLDPCGPIQKDIAALEKYLSLSWQNFYQQ